MVEPSSCGQIQIQFSPLEAREYCVELKVKIIGGKDQCLRIKGIGQGVDSDSPAFLNNKSKIDETTALCSLSLDRIQLGNIPLGSPVRRIIFIENRSAVTSAHFSWNCRSEFLSIEPRQGKLEPRERMLIKVEYCQSTSSPPSFHSIETHCDIVSVTDLTKYLKALAKWEKEKKRQEEEFTIDDSKHPPNQITLIEGDRPMSPYRALPPLSPKKKRTRDITWVKPIQPKPDQLQLTVNARSLTRVEFLEKYPEEFNYYFMKGSSNEESESKIECTGEETRMMKTVMANILRTLLDDKYIQQLLLEQQNEKPVNN